MVGNRVYTLGGGGLTVQAALSTIVGFLPSTTVGAGILRIKIGWSGAATSAQQRIEQLTQVTAYGTAVTATPQKTKFTDPTANLAGVTGALTAGKCGITFSAEGGGAKTIIDEDVFNVLNGYLWVATPYETVVLGGGSASAWGLQFPASPGSGTNPWSVQITYQELG